MFMWKGLILLGLLLVGCSSDPAVNQATHDRAVSELRAEIHAARDMLKDQTAINTSLTEKNEALGKELEANHTEAQKKIADLEVRLDAVKNERTRFAAGEAIALVVEDIASDIMLYPSWPYDIGYANLLEDWKVFEDIHNVRAHKVEQRCAMLQIETTSGYGYNTFKEVYTGSGIWRVSLTIDLPRHVTAKAQSNFQFEWLVYEKSNAVIAVHDQLGVPIC